MQPRNRFTARVTQAFAATGLPRVLSVVAAADGAPSEILLYDEIGFWGVTATDFAAALKDAGPGPVKVRINSPGGDVFDGLAIYNMLLAHPGGVSTMVDGLAASAASYIAMAGDTVSMAESSQMMVHNAWGLSVGNRHDMTKTADVLARIDGQLADIYTTRTGQDKADVVAMMDAETWLTANDAKAAGFCNEVVKPAKAKDAADMRPNAAARHAMRAAYDGEALPTPEPEPVNEKPAREKRLRLAKSA